MKIVQFKAKIKLKLPLFGSKLQAGFPSPADDFLDTSLDLNELIIKHPASTFFVKAIGDSMVGAGIFPNSLLVVDRYTTAINGQVVVAVVNGEFTVKRYVVQKGKTYLQPENPEYPKIEVKPEDDFSVWGVVIQVLHDPSKI